MDAVEFPVVVSATLKGRLARVTREELGRIGCNEYRFMDSDLWNFFIGTECRLPITDNEGAIGSALYFCGNCVSQCRVTQPKRLLQWKQDHSNCGTICYRCLIQAKIYPEQFTTEHSYINALVEYENHLTDSF